jgi:minor extracellular serine protease Vpr
MSTKNLLLLSFATFFLSNSIFSQAKLNASANVFFNELKKVGNIDNQDLNQKFITDYDLIKINGVYHIGVLAIVDENNLSKNKVQDLNIINDTKLNQLWSMRVPIHHFGEFILLDGIKYIEIGEPVSPLLELCILDARVDSVHQGLGGLAQSYRGKGVIVAIIDWGFDYTHPNFYDTTFSDLRLSRAWDQNKLSGPAPNGYSFGTEYVGQSELLAGEQDTLYVFGPGSHGTHVAGIAGGTGAGTVHGGVATESELIFISLRRDAPSLIDAFSYVTNYAAQNNKPYVINMSFGSHLGPHDGTSLKNLGIDILHGPGKVFVGSAGNNGTTSNNFHLNYNFISNPNDTLKTVVGYENITDMFGQTLSMWGSAFSSFGAAIRLVDNSNNLVYETPFYHTSNQPFVNDTLLVGANDTLIIRIQSDDQHFLNNKSNIRLEVKRTGNYKVILLATSDNSDLHVWNNVRMNSRYTNWGVSLSSNYPGATAGDNDFGLGEPAGVGKNVITVGSYAAEKLLSNGNYTFGGLSGFSSKGPTVDLRVKPDITSTGSNVISSVNSFDPTYTIYTSPIDFNGKTYGFRSFSGTSMSGPMVTGIVALMLEAYPNMSATQIKEVLKSTARLDQHTGTIGSAGHLQWGWGKANALAAIKSAELMSSVENISISENLFSIFPNPAKDRVELRMENEISKIIEINIFSINGTLVKKIPGNHMSRLVIHTSDFSSGSYIISVQTEQSFEMKKLIIQ